MTIPIEEKKAEAISRMKKIGLFEGVIDQFDQEGLINESLPPVGACYWIRDGQKQRIKEFEEKYNALVYHVIHGKYGFSDGDIVEMEAYLYVSDYPEEWEMDREDISNPEALQALCYINNITYPDFSEFGAVGFEVSPAAGLLRTW